MSDSNKDFDWMIKLRSLLPNWDGDDAPVPSEESILKTKDIVEWITKSNLHIESIDSDVLGGVAIYLIGINNRMVWISILNKGNPCIVFRCRPCSKVVGRILNDSSLEELKLFLTKYNHELCDK